jgi:uroporphyrinogen decarboxylase
MTTPPTTPLSHWDRVRATLAGEQPDRPPICLWRHWPQQDQTPTTLAAAMIEWQRELDCDLVKHAPAGCYVVEDWGGRTAYIPANDPGLGVRTMTRHAVTRLDQWPALETLDVQRGHLGRQLDALRRVTSALGATVPVLQTLFSPLNVARKLAGDQAIADMRSRPDLFKHGLQTIAETMARFALESVHAGAAGIIFSSPCNQNLFSADEYREFGVPFDRLILETVRPAAEIIVLFASGAGDLFNVIADYPIDAVNWGHRPAGPTLQQALARFPGSLWGGLDERQTLRHGPPAAIQAQVHAAIAQTGRRRLIIGTESAPPIDTPRDHFHAARRAVQNGHDLPERGSIT